MIEGAENRNDHWDEAVSDGLDRDFVMEMEAFRKRSGERLVVFLAIFMIALLVICFYAN